METTKTIYELHEEHKTWLNKLLFYKDELFIMENRISEIAEKNTSTEVRTLIDYFYNQISIQKEEIDFINHDINSHEAFLEDALRKNHNSIQNDKFLDHKKHRESVTIFEKLFRELREELIEFLSKWM
ncbi:hypothetical protein [Flavobacterium weaverense]|uniref:Hemerythrin HHE cation binding domain-containing protein n=1 Tax=Flavobacterium weaverense TaxID=271156 RepID=A0A3L9ZJE1_9FLAO|nr:hypothetical protein [Flavobacterium weaverense]RMA72504.1 hypothetical protein BC961_2906 [Flavobacterium weaverense]